MEDPNLNIPSNQELIDLKIGILGISFVGKSSLVYRFIYDKFLSEQEATIEEQFSKTLILENINCKLDILDTAGQDDYQSMIDTWINSVDGYILVYSIDNYESFEAIKVRYDRIIKNKKNKNFSIIVVGNKCDLTNNRKVTTEEAENYCKELNVNFLECSALENINVKETFLSCAKNLLKIQFPQLFPNGKKKRVVFVFKN